MTRLFGPGFRPEIVVLGLVEWAIAFAAINFMLVSVLGAGGADLAGQMHPDQIHTKTLSATFAFTIGAVVMSIGLYRPAICRVEYRRLLVNVALAAFLAFPTLVVVSKIIAIDLTDDYLLGLTKGLIAWVVLFLATRLTFSFVMRHRLFMRRLMVVGAGKRATQACDAIKSHRGNTFEIATTMPDIAALAACPTADGVMFEMLREKSIWGIVVASDGDHGDVLPALLDLKLRGIRVFDDLTFCERYLGRIDLDRVSCQWLTFADGFSNSRLDGVVKRIMDIVCSLALLALTLPLMLITALLIRLDSPGPVFYRQERVGLHGKPFILFKFRSMSVDAEAGGKPRWASQKDPRITRIGGFTRSTRIDELPQLFNVLRGEMSFIGPRPERPHFVEQLGQIIPFYHERSYVKPGITGWAQVNFPYGASVEDARQKLSFDLYYVKNRSLILDILIIFATVRVILFREGSR